MHYNILIKQKTVADELEHQLFDKEDEETALINKFNRQTSHTASLRRVKIQTQASTVSHHSEQVSVEDTAGPTEEEVSILQ